MLVPQNILLSRTISRVREWKAPYQLEITMDNILGMHILYGPEYLAHDDAHGALGKVSLGLNIVKELPSPSILHHHGQSIGQSDYPLQFNDV